MDRTAIIHFPAEKGFLSLGLAFGEEFARSIGMNEELAAIRLGLEEALVNVMAHGCPEDNRVELRAQADSFGVEYVIRERGIPFDPEAMERQAASLESAAGERGVGLKLMKTFMDKVSFASLGKEGKETRLYKQFSTPPVESFVSEPEPDSNTEKQGDINYTVRLMHQDEALDVARCAYFAYGYSFIVDSAYDVKAIRELNRNGQLVSMVAVTEDGDVMGHASMALDEDPLCGAWGRAFVRKKYRRLGCLKAFAMGLMQEAQARNLQWVVADAVCSHPYSQRAIISFGFEACCLVLARTPPLDLKGIKDAQERESILLCYRRVSPQLSSPLLFFPPNHAEFIEYLYQGLGETPEFVTGQRVLPANPAHEMTVVVESLETVTIVVETCGPDVVPEVKNALRSACLEGLKGIYLLLNLADPFTAVLTAEFEAMGFFFGGIRPRSDGRDQLVLQYLNNVVVDFDAMQIVFEQGVQLKDYVRKCESRVVKPWG